MGLAWNIVHVWRVVVANKEAAESAKMDYYEREMVTYTTMQSCNVYTKSICELPR
jgi:hypothetical protein